MDLVKCEICGKELKNISYLHLRMHNITFEEYVKQFPGTKTCSNEMKEARNKKLLGRKVTDEVKAQISKSNKESWLKNPNQGRTGVSLSEESKAKLSEKLMGHEVSEETRKKIGESGLGREPWNKDLTKKDDPRLAAMGQKVSEYNKNMPQERRDKIAETLKQKYLDGMKIPNAKNGTRKDLGMSFRSAWEANYARILLYRGEEIVYEVDRFKLVDEEGKICVYVPDFKVGENKYIEVKGHCRSADNWDCNCLRCIRDKKKARLMKKLYPEIEIIMIGKEEYRKICEEYICFVDNWENTSYDPK